MNNISSLGVLREQLNLYVQELLKVKIIDIDTGINYNSLKDTKSTPAEASTPVKSGRHLKLILPDNEE